MLRKLSICLIAAGLLAGVIIIPSCQMSSDPGYSPLYSQSLSDSKDRLEGREAPGPSNPKDGEVERQPEGDATCLQGTCVSTCSGATCGYGQTCWLYGPGCATFSGATCAPTYCISTYCPAGTCEATCVGTCATYSGPTCEYTCPGTSTCVETCSGPTCGGSTCSGKTCGSGLHCVKLYTR